VWRSRRRRPERSGRSHGWAAESVAVSRGRPIPAPTARARTQNRLRRLASKAWASAGCAATTCRSSSRDASQTPAAVSLMT
jgi:hypothetical protein